VTLTPTLTTIRTRWSLLTLAVVEVAVPVVYTAYPVAGEPHEEEWALPVGIGLLVGALLVRHCLAAAAGRRPTGSAWTLVALAVLGAVPGPLWGWENWYASGLWAFGAVALMVLPRGAGIGCLAASGAYITGATIVLAVGDGLAPGVVALWALYSLAGVVPPAVLYGAVVLTRMLDELHATRVELAEAAVGRERLRVARDVHDLLGQSLSAVSLKGDLALRLLTRDPPAARAEIEGITALARDALHGMSAITRDDCPVSLATELDGAVVLLGAAGVAVRSDVRLPDLPPAAQQVLAWGVREGVTNLIRHSDARRVTLTVVPAHGRMRLELVNDGAGRGDGGGSGLAGIAERATAVGGSATSGRLPGGRFRLVVEVPHGGEERE
jgi:two-component system sensor histidine kinase DesK